MKDTVFDLCCLVQQAMFSAQPLTRFPAPDEMPGTLKNVPVETLGGVIAEAVEEGILEPVWVRQGQAQEMTKEEWENLSQEQMAAYIFAPRSNTGLMGLAFTTGGHYLYCEECSERCRDDEFDF